jgi:hypothetical protein
MAQLAATSGGKNKDKALLPWTHFNLSKTFFLQLFFKKFYGEKERMLTPKKSYFDWHCFKVEVSDHPFSDHQNQKKTTY